ncbi:MAG: hypothetical protein JST04_17170 [Bdellovibrionales bacterium]|nr:hypothetical protein [Bdellovibrionales bacterium]
MSEITKSTIVDLGDDLLQTRTTERPKPESPLAPETVSEPSGPAATDSIEELLLNAKIQIREDFLEDAKKTLRRVMRMSPGNLAARDRLEEIQRIEIKRLLGQDDQPTGGGFRAKKKKAELVSDDGDSVAAALERELGPAPGPEATQFPNDDALAAFLGNLELLLAGASTQDRIDLGIGFLEMEFYEVAVRMFRGAAAADPGDRRARGLLATAWVAKGNGFEAMLEIESLVADQSAPSEEKIDYGYLAGRAQELMGNFEMAIRWYRAVLQVQAGYRDAEDRLRRCVKLAHVKRVET